MVKKSQKLVNVVCEPTLTLFLAVAGKSNCQLDVAIYPQPTNYGRPMKLFFIEIQNFWAWADKLAR